MALKFAMTAIIHGYFIFLLILTLISSKAAGDFGSCSGELETECLKCDSASHRDLVSATGKCRCNNGTYDDGENNTCADCHYSWLLYHLFF